MSFLDILHFLKTCLDRRWNIENPSKFSQMSYSMLIFFRGKFEMMFSNLQSYKITKKLQKMSKKNNFQSCSNIFGRPWNYRNNEKLSNFLHIFYSMHVFYRAKFEIVIFHLQSKTSKNSNLSKNDNFWSFSTPFWQAVKLIGEILKNHQMFHRCSTLCIFSTEKILRW